MERTVSIPPHNLSAVVTEPRATPDAIVLLVHGLTGDMNQKGRFVQLSNALSDRNILALRFDMRGRGRSEGYLTPLTMIEDIRCVADWVGTRHHGSPCIVVARGEGAYASLVALGKENEWRHFILWGAILFPRTSRELQGDYHTFREEGRALLSLPDGSEILFTQEYFDALEKIPSVSSSCREGLDLTFIHTPNDEIAPLDYVQDFCSKARSVQHAVVQIDASGHMHRGEAYVDEYLATTLDVLERIVAQ